jgi:osmoprotectant transport system ATP-binding protein
MRVGDVDLWEAPLASAGEAAAAVRERVARAEVPYALLVDGERRPLGWLSESDLAGERVPERPDSSPEPILDIADVLRDALSDVMQAHSQYAPVVDGIGRVRGVLSVEIIQDFLGSPEAATDTQAAVDRPAV